jgi:hypothetical protein
MGYVADYFGTTSLHNQPDCGWPQAWADVPGCMGCCVQHGGDPNYCRWICTSGILSKWFFETPFGVGQQQFNCFYQCLVFGGTPEQCQSQCISG